MKTKEEKMNKTFAMIKPDAIENKNIGSIITMIEKNGFQILRMQFVRLSILQVESFYEMHKGKSFFEELIEYITSGPVVLLALQKENAVQEWRKLIGSTNPVNAEVGTIRKMYAESIGRNAVHGSDSAESAVRELEFFFNDLCV
jgi:nucleoside-diphosphate kinase